MSPLDEATSQMVGAMSQMVGQAFSAALAPLAAELRALRALVAPPEHRWGSRREAADFYGASRDTIDRRVKDGTLRSRRLGRKVLVEMEGGADDIKIAALARTARRG